VNILKEIIHNKRSEVESRRRETPIALLQARPFFNRKTNSLYEAIRRAPGGLGIIAEFKRRSPSAGTIDDRLDPAETARLYEQNGAAAISVLTDERYFGGSLGDLERVRNAVGLPLLRKDFIIDEYQLHEAKACGADAVLLIADVLAADELMALYTAAEKLGLECLVELYDPSMVEKIDASRMKLIGINNRDLRTFTVDLEHTNKIIQLLPENVLVVSESGIHTAGDLHTVRSFGARGALIGESLMKDSGKLAGFAAARTPALFKKICGITNADDALAATDLGADAVGFIFYNGSPRCISPADAAAIVDRLPDRIQTAGVFVNRPRAEIERIVSQTGIGIVQLHGDEQPDECRFDSLTVWKAVRPRGESDLDGLDTYSVAAFLFDTYDENRYGGTGKTGNWELARTAAQNRRIILSGGLNPDNIADAIAAVRPFGVDINSGVESSPGRKDLRKLERVFKVLKQYNDLLT
jgi:indole-3-glycerol phosphate synthase / phosphoribosylanthranilate isomerase